MDMCLFCRAVIGESDLTVTKNDVVADARSDMSQQDTAPVTKLSSEKGNEAQHKNDDFGERGAAPSAATAGDGMLSLAKSMSLKLSQSHNSVTNCATLTTSCQKTPNLLQHLRLPVTNDQMRLLVQQPVLVQQRPQRTSPQHPRQ